ncbi:hypothetical protein AVEN_262120-1 [Araneus ventricosus]|uniref:Uncharacterized protein n=1 Tax=Araneus ventricosus TaxID=182803 RepID=A0A4Y2E879_ARAVE|nr:hypothetical protein AVEN_262120-1 [Araneus ventricosus]
MSEAKDSYRTEMVLKRKKCVTQPNEKLLSKEAAKKLSAKATKLQRNVHLKKMHKISLKSRVPSSNKHPINENVTEKSVKEENKRAFCKTKEMSFDN